MTSLPLPLVILGVIVIVVAMFASAALRAKDTQARKSLDDKIGFVAREVIFSAAERSFLGVLDQVVPDGVAWLGKIRIGDIVVPQRGISASARMSALNRINQKHVDFLLVRVTDFAPLAGIELDDGSHQADDRKNRDAFVDTVFRSAGIPLFHVKAQAAYNPAELKALVLETLEKRAVTISGRSDGVKP